AEVKTRVAVDAVQVNPIRRKLGDGRVNLPVDATERRASARLRDVDRAIDAPHLHTAVNLADRDGAVHAVGFEIDFARQFQHHALAPIAIRTERREDAAPVFFNADAKLAQIVFDADLVEAQVFAFLGRADDQDFGVINVRGFDIDRPVGAGDPDVRAGFERVATTNLLALGEINAFAAFVHNGVRLGFARIGARSFPFGPGVSFSLGLRASFGVRRNVAGRDVLRFDTPARLRLIVSVVTSAGDERQPESDDCD